MYACAYLICILYLGSLVEAVREAVFLILKRSVLGCLLELGLFEGDLFVMTDVRGVWRGTALTASGQTKTAGLRHLITHLFDADISNFPCDSRHKTRKLYSSWSMHLDTTIAEEAYAILAYSIANVTCHSPAISSSSYASVPIL